MKNSLPLNKCATSVIAVSGGICDMHCSNETIHIQKADTNEVSAMAEVLHLEPTTTYSVSIAAKTDHGTYGPPLKTLQLFKTLASPPNKPTISKTSVTSTGNVVVSQPLQGVKFCTKLIIFVTS